MQKPAAAATTAKPAAAAPAAAPAPAPAAAPAAASSGAAEYIFVTSVQGLYFYNPTSRSYESRATSVVGCVIVGSGASYSLMFYDSNRTTLVLAPITQQVRVCHTICLCLSSLQ
jgi:hypothetical protein